MAPPAKRRKLDPLRRQKPVEELTFSIDARQEYLTGFSKRKQARKEQAREHAIQMAKEEKVRERKELREQRKADLESHVAEVNKVLKQQNALANGRDVDDISSSDDEFSGFDNEDSASPAVAEVELPDEAEYVDEDKYTTVTVEPMGETSSEEEEDGEDGKSKDVSKTTNSEPEVKKKKRPWDKTGDGGVKKKKQKFRYESKAERSLARSKQKSKNSKAAKERKESGGGSSSGKGGKGGRKKK